VASLLEALAKWIQIAYADLATPLVAEQRTMTIWTFVERSFDLGQ
jgi:hypothetical protein